MSQTSDMHADASEESLGRVADPQHPRCTLQMPFFQQFTGVNAIIFYSPVFFSTLGSGDKTALESTCIVGAVNVLATLVAVFGVDKLGRRTLLLEAGVQMFIAEVIVAILLGERLVTDPSAAQCRVSDCLVPFHCPTVLANVPVRQRRVNQGDDESC